MPDNHKPVHEVRVGSVKAAIWENPTDNGVRHNVTFERLYKSDDEWKQTQSFGRDDLLVLAKVADQAHTRKALEHANGRCELEDSSLLKNGVS